MWLENSYMPEMVPVCLSVCFSVSLSLSTSQTVWKNSAMYILFGPPFSSLHTVHLPQRSHASFRRVVAIDEITPLSSTVKAVRGSVSPIPPGHQCYTFC